MAKNKKIEVQGLDIVVYSNIQDDFISLTDIAKFKNLQAPADVVKNWLRSKQTIALLGVWERLNNPNFKLVEFDRFKNEAGYNHFTLSPKQWIEKTNAIGIVSKSGRYGGTFAHKDIALEQRLKEEENDRLKLEWNLQRTLAKVNYQIHTDAIKENLIPQEISKQQMGMVYANEADLLNVALFGQTAKDWREQNLDKQCFAYQARIPAKRKTFTIE